MEVGQFCSFAYGPHSVLGGEHRSDVASIYRYPAYPRFNQTQGHQAGTTWDTKGPADIGNDVSLGHQLLSRSRATIDDGAIVAAVRP